VRIRARPAMRKRWEEAAELRGETLSEFLRRAADERASRQAEDEVASTSAAQQGHSARAKAPATLEQRLQAIGELVDGLGS
jgi:cell pole-organizing protein PopZ